VVTEVVVADDRLDLSRQIGSQE